MPRSREQVLAELARMNDEMDARLKESQTLVDNAFRAYEEAKQVRNAVFEEAIGYGWSMGRIGRACGLTRQRVAQLRKEAQDS